MSKLCLFPLAVCLLLQAGDVISGDEATRAAAAVAEGKAAGKVVLEARGYITPARTVLVGPEIGGRVIELLFEQGTEVKEGDVLARLDPTQYKLEYQRARARLDRARARYEALKAGSSKQPLEAAKAEVAMAEAELGLSQYRLDNTQIRAPISGTVLTKKAEKGMVVNPLGFNIPASICELADLSDLEVDLWVQEQDLHLVFRGQDCEIRPTVLPRSVYNGRVSRLLPVGDRSKGAFPVRIRIDLPKGDRKLRPEMSATVSLLGKETAHAPGVNRNR